MVFEMRKDHGKLRNQPPFFHASETETKLDWIAIYQKRIVTFSINIFFNYFFIFHISDHYNKFFIKYPKKKQSKKGQNFAITNKKNN